MSWKENSHRLLEEGSIATFQTTLSAIPQAIVERKHSRLTLTQTSQARPEVWMKTLSSLVYMLHQTWDDGCWVSMTKLHLIMTKIYLMSLFSLKNSNKLKKKNWKKLEQAVSKASYLWPYYCRKGAEWPDLQQCKLPMYFLLTACGLIVIGREQSNLMNNTVCCCTDCCWKGAKWPDGQHYLLLHRPL